MSNTEHHPADIDSMAELAIRLAKGEEFTTNNGGTLFFDERRSPPFRYCAKGVSRAVSIAMAASWGQFDELTTPLLISTQRETAL